MAPFRIIGAVSDNGISFVTALEFYKLEKNYKSFSGVSLLTYWYINVYIKDFISCKSWVRYVGHFLLPRNACGLSHL